MKTRLAQASDEAALLHVARCLHQESRFANYRLQKDKRKAVVTDGLKDTQGGGTGPSTTKDHPVEQAD